MSDDSLPFQSLKKISVGGSTYLYPQYPLPVTKLYVQLNINSQCDPSSFSSESFPGLSTYRQYFINYLFFLYSTTELIPVYHITMAWSQISRRNAHKSKTNRSRGGSPKRAKQNVTDGFVVGTAMPQPNHAPEVVRSCTFEIAVKKRTLRIPVQEDTYYCAVFPSSKYEPWKNCQPPHLSTEASSDILKRWAFVCDAKNGITYGTRMYSK
jgi:hypothetical protein